jgi:NADP-dependent 3-hydroxy acid dehydrogenase YdfG
MRSAVQQVEEAEGAVGALVNNAGYSQSGAIESVRLDDVRRQFETNVFGLIRMCQLVLPGMRRQRHGRIVNLSSMGGKLDRQRCRPGGALRQVQRGRVETMTEAYEGPMARLAAGPDAVARAIEKAITARRPRTRYKVAASARVMLGLRALLPDRAWDSAVGSSFKRPGA